MNDIDKHNLLYKPNLQPERNYLSDGSFVKTNTPPLEPEKTEQKDYTPKELYDDFKEIIRLFDLLPDDVSFFKESLKKVQDRIVVAYPEGYTEEEQPEERPPAAKELPESLNTLDNMPDKLDLSLQGVPDLFPKMTPIVLKIEQPKTLVQLIQDAYSKDQIDLNKYYTQKLQTIMQQYYQRMLTLMAECGVPSIDDLMKDFDGDQVKVPSGQGLEHLRDEIVRSQVTRKQIASLFKKTHSVDNTLKHMRAWHAAYEQRQRYYSEEYKDSSSFVTSHSNSLLREARKQYDNAYNSGFYNMYKYLNSSVMMTNDILNRTVKEAQAKAELLKNNVDIFAVNPELIEFAKNESNAGQIGDGGGSGFDESNDKNKENNNLLSDVKKESDKSVSSTTGENASDNKDVAEASNDKVQSTLEALQNNVANAYFAEN